MVNYQRSQFLLALVVLFFTNVKLIHSSTQPHDAPAYSNPIVSRVMLSPKGSVFYRVGRSNKWISFQYNAHNITAVDSKGKELWSTVLNGDDFEIFGIGDFDSDGSLNLGIYFQRPLRNRKQLQYCGSLLMQETRINLISSKTGTLYQGLPYEPDICWNFEEKSYPTHQWTNISVLFGHGPTLALSSYYNHQKGWFFTFKNSSFIKNYFYYPSTPKFAKYKKSQFILAGDGKKYIPNAFVANGLIVTYQEEERLILLFKMLFCSIKSVPIHTIN